MKVFTNVLVMILAWLLMSCTVMPHNLQKEALPDTPFAELIRNTNAYIGQITIQGGYVVSVSNHAKQTQLIAIQAPLGFGQEPKSKDLSQGRLILDYDGFIDPEVYSKDRKITVAGVILGSSTSEANNAEPFPYVRLEVKKLHLWAKEQPVDRGPPYWSYPYPPSWGWRYPYWY